LKDYHNSFECRGNGQGQIPPFRMKVRGKISDDLFGKFATNLKNMIATANKNQNELTSVLDALFTYTTDPDTKKDYIRVNPELTDEILQNIIVKTRSIIVTLYLTCEKDFIEGVKIYEAIVKQRLLEVTQSQIVSLNKLDEKLTTITEKVPEPAENKVLEEKAEKTDDEQKAQIELERKKELPTQDVKEQNIDKVTPEPPRQVLATA
jgi:hypothetical protein